MPDYDNIDEQIDDLLDDDDEPIEAYCVSCKQKVEMEDPQPVWTRKGTPATRGFCAVCGTAVFRMGKTPAHRNLKKPEAVSVGESTASSSRKRRVKNVGPAVYVNFTAGDSELAQRLATDLANMGVPTWITTDEHDDVVWASGVHPALDECKQMLVVLSPAALADESVQAAWAYFKQARKPLVVAQTGAIEVPDDLRRAPRVDFRDAARYRPALRELVQALAE